MKSEQTNKRKKRSPTLLNKNARPVDSTCPYPPQSLRTLAKAALKQMISARQTKALRDNLEHAVQDGQHYLHRHLHQSHPQVHLILVSLLGSPRTLSVKAFPFERSLLP